MTTRSVAKRATRGARSTATRPKRKPTSTARKKKAAAKKTSQRGQSTRVSAAGRSAASLSAKATTTRRTRNRQAGAGRGAAKTNGAKKASVRIAPPATSQDPIQFPEDTRPLPKTRLTDKDLREFTELLLRKRAELCGDIERLTSEALSSKGQGQGDHSAMPIHMADLGSDNWEQEFTLGLVANEQALVREIDEALDRIEAGTYGVCLGTRRMISKARLRAKPWAKYCITYARAREEGRAF